MKIEDKNYILFVDPWIFRSFSPSFSTTPMFFSLIISDLFFTNWHIFKKILCQDFFSPSSCLFVNKLCLWCDKDSAALLSKADPWGKWTGHFWRREEMFISPFSFSTFPKLLNISYCLKCLGCCFQVLTNSAEAEE